MRSIAVIVSAALALLLAGCGTLEVIPKGAEQVIRNVVREHTGLQAVDVHCPSGVEAKRGNSFNCTFKANGTSYVARMYIVRVKAPAVYYDVRTRLASG